MRISEIVYILESAVSLPMRSMGITAAQSSSPTSGHIKTLITTSRPKIASTAKVGLLMETETTNSTPEPIPTRAAGMTSEILGPNILERPSTLCSRVDNLVIDSVDGNRGHDVMKHSIQQGQPGLPSVVADEDTDRSAH